MALYVFTWNLNGSDQAHDLVVDHLALRATMTPFIACLQELPGKSKIARARREPQPDLVARNISVVTTTRLVPGVALLHSPGLTLADPPEADEDGEYLAAAFNHGNKRVVAVGVHAKSTIDMQRPEDRGASRALLRHAVNALPLAGTRVVLGDFNSSIRWHEMKSWHGFYSLAGNQPTRVDASGRRRGHVHSPLYALHPANEKIGTYVHRDSSGTENLVVDFIIVDEYARTGASSEILTQVAGEPVWDLDNERPALSDHLPVEGMIDI